jgi:hypothetical protein
MFSTFSTFSARGESHASLSASLSFALAVGSGLIHAGAESASFAALKMKTPQTAFQSSCRLLISTSGTWFQAGQSVLCVSHTIPSLTSLYIRVF